MAPPPPLSMDNMVETVQATLAALSASPTHPAQSRATTTEGLRAVVEWVVAGDIEYRITINPWAVVLFRMWPRGVIRDMQTASVSELTRHSLSRMILRFITGKYSIPVGSRKEMKQTEEVAKANALYHYRMGMNHIVRGNLVENWDHLDMPDRWDAVVSAAYDARGGTPSDFMWYYRKACVALDVFDVYDDVYVETAFDLLSPLEVAA